jgi:cation:H+ antiporter
MVLPSPLLLAAGLIILIVGGELLVRSASALALRSGLPPVVIGLTVVAFGTSAPELAVGIDASLAGAPDLVIGNVVGSNIFNVLLVLGLAATIIPLRVEQRLVQLDIPILVGASAAFYLMASDGRVDRSEGLVLLIGIIGLTVFSIVQARRAGGATGRRDLPVHDVVRRSLVRDLLTLVAGLGLLVVGARLLVAGAVSVATSLGLSELVIGLTVVALGTSLPEIATSVIAALRGERDLAVGNVVGSNLFNLGAVLGTTALVSPAGIPVAPGAIEVDIPIMAIVAIACLPVFFTGHLIARWEGLLFLGYCAAYVGYLALDAVGHHLLPAFTAIVMLFAVPLTVVTLLVLVFRATRERVRRRVEGG